MIIKLRKQKMAFTLGVFLLIILLFFCSAGELTSYSDSICEIFFKGKFSKYIKKNSVYAIGIASVGEINRYNILNASLLSMKRALNKLESKPSIAYIDGIFVPKNMKIKCKTSFQS